ncbi:response regulator transcription factor [Polynucleobacter paneuropaeus]|jgi:two-component system response regulator TtrR|nr:response regulator transcription factor [Polynucleobacter paneuropaeus]MBT8593762.1 response regulator transcription factor [Polynucleobacter paneuropaeus]MBT8604199.1 response regulator transcription factor [Polynucleobacter paneuropaeus]QWD25460.1 response regulator transcription factor [Polynucleobacter paneuropaeus]
MALNANIPTEHQHIFVIEDDESMLETLSGVLTFLGYQVHLFSNPLEFLKITIQVAPAIIITDMRMPDMSGVELQAELLKRGRQVPIIFISGESTVPQTISAMKQGAIEFLTKPFEREQLMQAVVRGLKQDAIEMHTHLERMAIEESLKGLAPRERQVFDLLSVGFNNAEIMARMGISLDTAKQYKSEVMRKLGLRSLSQLIALKRGNATS